MKNQNSKIESVLQEKLGGKVLLGESLKYYTTMKVGGVAKFLYKAKDSGQVLRAIKVALDLKLSYFILGKGGNVIFSDDGFEGLMIVNQASKVSFFEDKAEVWAESGITNGELVMKAAEKGFGGIEFLATIPGTLGGALYGNVGAYGWEIGSFVKSISLLILPDKSKEVKVVKKPGSFLKPLYRSTILKRLNAKIIAQGKGISWGSFHPIILSATLQLQRKKPEQIAREIGKLIEMRRKRQPQGIISSGSTFKNPLGRSSKIDEVYKDIKKTASYMLDNVGAKKIKVGDARVSDRHANFFTHSGKATAQNIKDLVQELQKRVYERYEVKLDPEIEFVGKFK
ncbi:UDP-N-acetylmuramate dehydrogenase [Candidatus Berkelbacteria bacterium]|nr:UDP-N-acetylmuramate dehydrogenase [Candidatus Berkelbacteria bacterium]